MPEIKSTEKMHLNNKFTALHFTKIVKITALDVKLFITYIWKKTWGKI